MDIKIRKVRGIADRYDVTVGASKFQVSYLYGFWSDGYRYGADRTLRFTVYGHNVDLPSPRTYEKKGIKGQVMDILHSTKIGKKIIKKAFRQHSLSKDI